MSISWGLSIRFAEVLIGTPYPLQQCTWIHWRGGFERVNFADTNLIGYGEHWCLLHWDSRYAEMLVLCVAQNQW